MVFFGCDAGSTKTEMMLVDARGAVLAHEITPACNYLMVGQEAFGRLMREKIDSILGQAGLSHDAITYSVFGLPAYGEAEEMEQGVPEALGSYAPPMHSKIVNDAVIAFAGSFGGQTGIHVVSGTGSMVYGEDEMGNAVRVGGWSLLFDDEGSGAWMGRQALSLFFRQADGRLAAGPLLDVFREHYGLKKNLLSFVGQNLRTLSNDRTALAKVQMLAAEAADRGDLAAAALYDRAVEKLAGMVETVAGRLAHSPGMPLSVSYSGGLFQNRERVLAPFESCLKAKGFALTTPLYSPVVGAVAMGAKQYLDASALKRTLGKAERAIRA